MEVFNKEELLGRYHPKGCYDPRFIRQVVEEVEAGLPAKAALIRYNLKKGTLRHWLHTSPYYKKRKYLYSASEKRSVVLAVRERRMSISEVMTAYGIKAAKTIKDWIAAEEKENADLVGSNSPGLAKKKTKDDRASIAATPEAVKSLQQELADAQLKIAALNILIDVAEEQLKIDIRKKPGAKQ